MEYLFGCPSRSYFFTISYLKVNHHYNEISNAKEILRILDDEISNKMPLDIIDKAKKILMKDIKI